MRKTILLLCLLNGIGAYAQTSLATQKAEALQKNVVAIKAKQDAGFGFIIGERSDSLFIVTAAHVLAGGREQEKSATIRFYPDKKKQKGQVVFADRAKDLALLSLPKPKKLYLGKK